MSTTALSSLLDYLYGTLSPGNMKWLGEHLIKRANEEMTNSPYTMEEIDSILDEAEKGFERGEYMTNDDVFRKQ
ncbi:MAG: hypothetical protein SOZ80_07725 [Prevotella sp.]|uniref:hypothetical protein n=1 Tax=Prevotella sp. TaxID=59823 RepID=UPI002A265B39|nr:hypothetical protein [Prevotella sp.]MDD7317730.1 hypothetical protein [Prevotellaceae bacterium]MDY4020645.1 hypothetical protein [Prevotella sp.]